MPLLHNFKNFFMKNDFDFDAPEITLYSFHPQFQVFFTAMGIFFNNQDSRVRFIWPILCVMLTTVAVTLESIFVHHGLAVKDYSFATECFCYCVLLGIISIVYTTIMSNKEIILELVEDMNNDFIYISSLEPKYRESFFKGHLLIYKLCYVWLAFTLLIAVMYITGTMSPLLWISLFATQDENMIRPLMFPMWLPEDDPYRTPNYEIFMCLQLSFCFIFIQTFCVYVYLEFHILLHYYNLMELVIMDFGVIFEGLDESVINLPRSDPRRVDVQNTLNKRMSRIVKWHLSIFKFIWPILCVMLTTVAVTLEFIFVQHGLAVKDYSFATECFCYCVLLGIIPIVYTTIMSNKEIILELVEDMNNDFIYISSLEPKYRESFFKGHLLIYKLCYVWLAFTLLIAVMYITGTMSPLLWISLFATQDENMIRPLMFPMWLPEDDPYRTPNYEIFMCLQLSFCFIFIQTFCVYVYLEFHILLHYYNLMELVIMDFGVIFEGLDESVINLPRSDPRRVDVQNTLNKRMSRIVKWHLSIFKAVETVSSVYGPPLVYQVMFTSLALCLMGYQIADKLDHGKFDILFSMLFLGCLIQLWIPCYLGTMLRNKGFALGDACWNCGWHETPLGRMLRNDILIVIYRSQQPVVIKFTGLPHVQLETFSSIVSTAYSYFNMLRQYNTEM